MTKMMLTKAVAAMVAVVVPSVVAVGWAGAAEDELELLASRTEAEFTKRNEGTFYNTEFRVYCRMGTGFDEGVFKKIDFEPVNNDYEYCYNVSDDLKKVALAATSNKDGSVRCVIIDASSGELERGEISDRSPCLP